MRVFQTVRLDRNFHDSKLRSSVILLTICCKMIYNVNYMEDFSFFFKHNLKIFLKEKNEILDCHKAGYNKKIVFNIFSNINFIICIRMLKKVTNSMNLRLRFQYYIHKK